MAKSKKVTTKKKEDESESEDEFKIQRKTIKTKQKKTKKSKKTKDKGKVKQNAKESKVDKKKSNKKGRITEKDNDDDDESVDSLEAKILPGQKYPTPPKGDPVRAYYESLLKYNPKSELALKHCIEYGILTEKEAIEGLSILNKEVKVNNKKK